MTTKTDTTTLEVPAPEGFESIDWKWTCYSGLVLIPLAWIQVLIQDVLVGVHCIDLDYVAFRWA
jgi:succinate dehydrogenase / fumarate reductase membrane anchor subunit